MKVLKYLGIGVGALVIVYLIWAALSPAKDVITRTIEIDRNPAFVYEVSKDFNFYQQWNPWTKMETKGTNEITGTGREIGDMWKWQGEKMGKGSMTHKEFVQDKKIVNVLDMPTWGSNADDVWTFEDKGGKTLVTWTETFNTPTPFLMRPFLARSMANTFEQGLADFKKMVEGMADLPKTRATNMAYDPMMEEMPAVTYLAIKDSCPVGDIQKHLQAALAKLDAYVKANKVQTTGAPMGIYWSYNPEGNTVFEAAVPVKDGSKGKGEIYVSKMNGGKTISVTHTGQYGDTEGAHMAIDKFAKEKGMKINEAIEVYESDPAKVKPEEVKTKVVYPVKG